LSILIGCEFTGTVRDAFRKKGYDAYSCDLIPSEDNSIYHIKDDIKRVATFGKFMWEMLIVFPPCTHLCVSGARWFKNKEKQQTRALDFIRMLMKLPIKKIAIENPIGIISTKIRKPDQIIQPWQFGHGETKATCLWLKNLPKLKPTHIVSGREQRIFNMPPNKDRGKNRSRTYLGIADAMAEQWG